ncbi:helix-turn-helix domain-containing protein [Micromonospora yangpuensis]|uniref:helix-turn-helix domain-containing protein n=1 Tax=Micromonospora yangpuensis TaxID=683228 RepID=UPI000AA45B07|nr:helix-turn-helix domain-containing protein [Micromonospora yangpuensis]GGM14492.1 transcriptional regulator [Micromonospora yangpuensis]
MSDDLPVGRRVAYWRARRKMSQQVFADRIGKSKSWVDKVERGVRRLDKWSVLQEVADALGVAAEVLVDEPGPAAPAQPAGVGVDEVRAALTRHPGLLQLPADHVPVDPYRYRARIVHADAMYGHAQYPALIRLLPGLLDDGHDLATTDRPPLQVQTYRLTALVLVKLGVQDLAWLAADRGLAVATGTDDPLLEAVAALPLGQALRAAGRQRAAFETTVTAAHQVAPLDDESGTSDQRSACATLLVQAALAAAEHDDQPTVRELLAGAMVLTEPDSPARAAVDAAQVTAAAALGDLSGAVELHAALAVRDRWRSLPVEHRAAHLVDVAPAQLAAGDPAAAGRALLDADRLAPAEVRVRPAGRAVLAEVLTGSPRPSPHLLAVAEAAGVDSAR